MYSAQPLEGLNCLALKDCLPLSKEQAPVICFFIVEHTFSKAVAQDFAERLLQAGCREFHFYGMAEPMWHLVFDEADLSLSSDSDNGDIAMTMGYSSLESFVEALPSDDRFPDTAYYLFYDDIFTYGKVFRNYHKPD